MISTSEAYKDAIIASRRRIIPRAVLNLVSPDVVYGTVTSSGKVRYVDDAEVYDKEFETTARYITMEHNYTLLDGKSTVAPDTPPDIPTGYVMDVISGEDRSFDSPYPFVQLNVTNVSVLQAASVYFSDLPNDGVAMDFTFEIYSGALLVKSWEVTGNLETAVYFEEFTAYDVTAMRLTSKKWSWPYRRPRVMEILPGIYERMTGSDIYMVDVLHHAGFDNMTIPYSTATLSVNNKSKRWNPYSKNSVFKSIEARQAIPITYSLLLPDGTWEEVPLGVFYQQQNGWETSANSLTMTFKLADIVGLLKDRTFGAMTSPTTLQGWIAAIVAKLGVNFVDHYIIDPSLQSVPITAASADVKDLTCGNLLRYLCMACGAYFRADPETGFLCVMPFGDTQGSYISLDNLNDLPTTSANNDAADITFKLGASEFVVSGNQTSSGQSLRIDNPFITTQAQARAAARNILVHYGGNKYKIVGRGDMSCAPGDIDAIESGFGSTVSGRRYKQQLRISKGVMSKVSSEFIQATGANLYENRVVITSGGTWTAPAGVTAAKLILIGAGSAGTNGTDGSFLSNGTPGEGGLGGKVSVQTINFNAGQSFAVAFGAETTFGAYSSASGVIYPGGWGDLYSGEVYASAGAAGILSRQPTQGKPGAPGTGNGGQGGSGGTRGVYGQRDDGTTVVKRQPGDGGTGGAGSSGCVIIYYAGV